MNLMRAWSGERLRVRGERNGPNVCGPEMNAVLNFDYATGETPVTSHDFDAGSAQNAPEYWTLTLASVASTRALSSVAATWWVPHGACFLAVSRPLSVEPPCVQARVERHYSATDWCETPEALFSRDLSDSVAASRWMVGYYDVSWTAYSSDANPSARAHPSDFEFAA